MWMLSFLPDSFLIWIINTILVLGLVGTFSSYVIKFVPPLMPYAGLIKTVGIILLVAGVWFRGGYDNEMSWRAKVADLEAKIAVSEKQSKEANIKLDAAIKEKVKIVKEVQVVIQDRIRESAAKMDSTCTVDNSVVFILNDAARNVKGTK
jgi:hypothetical protein